MSEVLTKEEIISRLKESIEVLRSIPKGSFYYGTMVKKFNKDKKRGTVCCWMGWYPKYFPEAGLIWKERSCLGRRIVGRFTVIDKDKILSTSMVLAKYHGLSIPCIYALFHGAPLKLEVRDKGINETNCIQVLNGLNATKTEVLTFAEYVLELLIDGKHDDVLILKS